MNDRTENNFNHGKPLKSTLSIRSRLFAGFFSVAAILLIAASMMLIIINDTESMPKQL